MYILTSVSASGPILPVVVCRLIEITFIEQQSKKKKKTVRAWRSNFQNQNNVMCVLKSQFILTYCDYTDM